MINAKVAACLFLTSKVRLHCDREAVLGVVAVRLLFLTSKVRLHCDNQPVQPV